ncbi:TetR family transcriptional regulator [Rhodococcus sp. IEGM 1379]|uniref:TetR/AcrR family transcriptional regulator n=1 Tax=Rhodococcus sp. IEGM 1379 TaxID=3047086 RepID=UPI0024B7975C|nr:TetR family transcriptional regulator [Rhodococcus sp. IEGM 1379]MDI9917560.1 TetR family transcriptional regulator [Rhodococcus sp. IEGM 1379]
MNVDRRTLIAECAVTIIADQGPRALTHRAVDQSLKLPTGSTSYYFRTREALLEAIARHIVERSRSTFIELLGTHIDPARLTAEYLDDLLTHRRNELIARHALLIEMRGNPALCKLLAGSLFSQEKAQQRFQSAGVADPGNAATDFLSLLEGLIFDHCLGARSRDTAELGTTERIRRLQIPIEAYLHGVNAR